MRIPWNIADRRRRFRANCRVRQFHCASMTSERLKVKSHALPRFPISVPGLPPRRVPVQPVKFALTNATSAFDDSSQSRYDKLWRISVLRVVVSFLFRIAILCLNAHGEIDGASSSDADCGAFITQE